MLIPCPSDVRTPAGSGIRLVVCTQEGMGTYRPVRRDDLGDGCNGHGNERLQGEFRKAVRLTLLIEWPV